MLLKMLFLFLDDPANYFFSPLTTTSNYSAPPIAMNSQL